MKDKEMHMELVEGLGYGLLLLLSGAIVLTVAALWLMLHRQ